MQTNKYDWVNRTITDDAGTLNQFSWCVWFIFLLLLFLFSFTLVFIATSVVCVNAQFNCACSRMFSVSLFVCNVCQTTIECRTVCRKCMRICVRRNKIHVSHYWLVAYKTSIFIVRYFIVFVCATIWIEIIFFCQNKKKKQEKFELYKSTAKQFLKLIISANRIIQSDKRHLTKHI